MDRDDRAQAERHHDQTDFAAYSMAKTDREPSDTPILHTVRGVLKEATPGDYREHLAAKHR
ncbi:MAG: hypothetical protein NTV70_12520 [Acidobacteria bacterium]|nr:hypothetical protein [Acidobacteriota bacterium]